MITLTFGLWLGELALELFGAYRSRRSRLFWIFAYLALADVLCIAIQQFWGWDAYIVAYWIAKVGKYALLSGLCAHLTVKLLNAYGWMLYSAAGLSVALGMGSFAMLEKGEPIFGFRLINGAIAALCVMVTVMALSYVGKTKVLPAKLNLIARGLFVLMGGELVVLVACLFWWPAHWGKWLPEYVQLGMWLWAVRAKQASFSVPLGVRVEAGAEQSRAEGV